MTTVLIRAQDVLWKRVSSRKARVTAYMSMALLGGLVGCGSDTATGIDHPERALLWVTMNTNAVLLSRMAPYNTIQLSATAHAADGSPISGLTPTFTPSDESLVVTDEGLVTALTMSTTSHVVATFTYQGVTKSDTTWISILDGPASPLDTFGISMSPEIAAGTSASVSITAYDEDGTDLSFALPVHFTTSNRAIATIDHRTGFFTAVRPEQSVKVYATSTVFGATVSDSLQVNIGYPSLLLIQVSPSFALDGSIALSFAPNVAYLKSEGLVYFCNLSLSGVPNTQPIDVVFENPEVMRPQPPPIYYPTGEGNIPPFMRLPENPLAQCQSRVVSTPGTYRYRSTLQNTSGTLIVR